MREIEIKIKLSTEENTKLQTWIDANMEATGQSEQLEYYLNNPNQTFMFKHKLGYLDAADYMRVRFEKEGGSVCLKRFKIDPETSASENLAEMEYKVDDPQAALELFSALGYTEQTKVLKRRRKYKNSEVEIVIDDVEGLGQFAEIELLDQVEDFNTGREKLKQVLKSIGYDTVSECARGYVSMLWNPGHEFGQSMQL
jgi:adenylate cyclase, class 2